MGWIALPRVMLLVSRGTNWTVGSGSKGYLQIEV